MSQEKIALCVGAHPDDAEFLCTGTLALLAERDWQIHIATLTPGDCGTVEYSREEISRIRKGEAASAVALLNGTYHCLECDDSLIMYDRESLLKTVALLRRVRPKIVFAMSPSDYMVDHEMASKLARSACFSCGIVNLETPGADAFEPTPYLYYNDPMEGKDIFGTPAPPTTIVDISSVIETKERMLCCHESQRSWLLAHHGMDQYVEQMKIFGRDRGGLVGVEYAEGFRQHLGHAYPQDNILKAELGDLVHTK